MPSSYLNHVSSEGAQEDYTGREFLVFFPAGNTNANITIPIVDDNVLETNENFSLTLVIPQPAQDLGVMRGNSYMATVIITNDERKCISSFYMHETLSTPYSSACQYSFLHSFTHTQQQ